VTCKHVHHHHSQRLPDRSEIGVAVGFHPSSWIWPLFGAVRVAISDYTTSIMHLPMLFNALGVSLALIFPSLVTESKGAHVSTCVAILHSVSMLSARPWKDLIARDANTGLRCIVCASPILTEGVFTEHFELNVVVLISEKKKGKSGTTSLKTTPSGSLHLVSCN
jgi:hypothetical protein